MVRAKHQMEVSNTSHEQQGACECREPREKEEELMRVTGMRAAPVRGGRQRNSFISPVTVPASLTKRTK